MASHHLFLLQTTCQPASQPCRYSFNKYETDPSHFSSPYASQPTSLNANKRASAPAINMLASLLLQRTLEPVKELGWGAGSAEEPGEVDQCPRDLFGALGLRHCLVELHQLHPTHCFHSTRVLGWQYLQLSLQPQAKFWTVILHYLWEE